MDLYITSLLLGVVGLGAMAVTGLGARGAGHGHVPVGHGGHAHGHFHAAGTGGAPHGGHGVVAHTPGTHTGSGATGRILALMSPRLLFSLALGFGASGMLLRPILGEPLLIAAAVLGAVLFDRALVSP